jgi:hypothetical protein
MPTKRSGKRPPAAKPANYFVTWKARAAAELKWGPNHIAGVGWRNIPPGVFRSCSHIF